ncbi:MAG: DUF4231 domain-containing protein [Lachnospira sp.]
MEVKEISKKCKKENCKESEQYAFLVDSIKDDILRERVKISLNYFINQAEKNRRGWVRLSIISIVLPAVASIVSFAYANLSISNTYASVSQTTAGSNGCNVIGLIIMLATPAITAATTVVNGLITFYKCGEKKTSYRNSAESLKSELNQFACCIGKYKSFAVGDGSELSAGKLKEKERVLAEAVEEILKKGYDRIYSLDVEEQLKKQSV